MAHVIRSMLTNKRILFACMIVVTALLILHCNEFLERALLEDTISNRLHGNIRYKIMESSPIGWNQGWKDWISEQERRRKVITNTCMKNFQTNQIRTVSVNHLNLNNLLVDDTHKTIYCYIPKVACSNWKRTWMILSGASNATGIEDIPNGYSHVYAPKMRLKAAFKTSEEILHKLQNYLKVIVVRHPIERLISAYLNKIHHERGRKSFQKQVYNYIKNIRKNANFTDIDWTEFIQFVVKSSSGTLNEHWRPFYKLCHPCHIDYDVIVKFETINEDAERFLRLINAPEHFHFPNRTKIVDTSLISPYLKNLTQSQLEGIKLHFGKDFDLFEYIDSLN